MNGGSIRVLKFGGSCLSSAQSVGRVGDIIADAPGKRVVVLSGIKGSTDLLWSYVEERSRPKLASFREMHLEIARSLFLEGQDIASFEGELDLELKRIKDLLYEDDEAVPKWVRDHVVTYGERLAVRLMGVYLKRVGIPADPMTSEGAGIAAVGEYGDAEADLELTRSNLKERVLPRLETGRIPLITGFYGTLPDGSVAIFGRNGSDYSATVIARALQASEIVLYKDVSGFMSADPAWVPEARILKEITMEEGIELSNFGARVMHPKTFDPILGTDTTVRVLDMNDPSSEGTRIIGSRENHAGAISVACKTGVTCIRLTVSGARSTLEMLCAAHKVLSSKGLNVISVVTSQTSIGLMVPSGEGLKAMNALEEGSLKGMNKARSEDRLAIVGLVGERLESEPDLLGRCFLDLVSKGIRTRMSGSGGARSAYYLIVNEEDAKEAVRTLHGTFWGGNGRT